MLDLRAAANSNSITFYSNYFRIFKIKSIKKRKDLSGLLACLFELLFVKWNVQVND